MHLDLYQKHIDPVFDSRESRTRYDTCGW